MRLKSTHTEDENLSPAQKASAERARLRKELQSKKEAKTSSKKAATKSNVHQADPISPAITAQLQRAFDHFNAELWGGALPQVVLLFARKPRSYGYFWAKRWGKDKDATVHEIALNPDHMRKSAPKDALSTVAHEMAHLWQHAFGEKCPTRPYHNKEFANEMERIGLMCSSTGEVGGKKTGQKMTHYIIDGAAFDKSATKLLKAGFKWDWSSFPVPPVESKSGKRIKYVCPECDNKAWGKEGLGITCEECEEHMEAA